jgi:hypothetical protein
MELDQCKPSPIFRIVEAEACLNAKSPFCRFGCRADQKYIYNNTKKSFEYGKGFFLGGDILDCS